MKYFVTGMIILCLLAGLCIYAEWEISKRSSEITDQLELALAALKDEDEAQAQSYLNRASEVWKKSKPVLASFISHDHTNGIDEEMAQLPWLSGNALGQAIEGLLKRVRGLAEMDLILWENIL